MSTPADARVGLLIQRYRRRLDLTQAELARRSGISIRALRDIEQQRVGRPRTDSLQRLLSVLDLSEADLAEVWAAGRPAAPPTAPQRNRDLLRVNVLGTMSVFRGDREVPIATAAQRGLLGLLALQPNQAVQREEIITMLWGTDLPRTCVSQVHAAVGQLRSALEPGRAHRSPGELIQLDRGGYILRLDDDQTDISTFGALLARARSEHQRGAGAASLDLLEQALRCWRGPVLADANVRLRDHPLALASTRQRLEATLLIADLALDLRRYEQAMKQVRMLIQDQPYHEGLHARLMLALAGCGERGPALQVFADVRRRLSEDLGVGPGDELRAAQLRVLRGEIPEPAQRTSPAPVTQLNPEPVVPFLLPPGVPDFTGRESQIKQVVGRLAAARPTAALGIVAVSGMGGVGKTALTVHAAHHLAPAYPDGQLFVNLRGAQSVPLEVGDVLSRFLRALGVAPRAVPHDLLERTELYRSRLYGRRLLVVLDDCASEEQIRPLLPGGATCAVLITSRARLSGVEGAHWIDLDVFEPDHAIRLLGRVVGQDRVKAEPSEAAEVARQCGRLPLAVRIAGARLAARPTWRLADLVGMLSDQRQRLDRLTAGDLAVRASLALSYNGLDATTQRLFRLLGLLDTPDFPAFVATALLACSTDQAELRLETLVQAQLLNVSGPAGQSRFRFHDLVRLYARERSQVEDSESDRAAALERGFGAWLAVAQEMAVPVPGPCYALIHGSATRPPVDLVEAGLVDVDPLIWFDTERTALQSVIHQSCALGMDELAFDLAGCMEKYFDIRGMYADWRAVNGYVLEACRAAGNLRGEAAMLRGLTDVMTWNSTDQDGEAMAGLLADSTSLLRMFTALGDRRGMSDAGVMRSWALSARGAYAEASREATEALSLAEETGHVGGTARAQVALALVFAEQGQFGEAITHLTRALERARAVGNPRYESAALQFLGIAHLQADNLDASQQVLSESLVISRRYRDHYTEVLTTLVQAKVYLRRGDRRAEPAALSSLALGREFTMPHHVADALAVLGEINLRAGRQAEAVTCLEESVRLWRTRGWPAYLAATLTSLGSAYGDADPRAAREAWQEARELFCGLGRDREVDQLTRQLADGTSAPRGE